MHYTTSRNVDGTIAWFQDPRAQVSAHYVIGRKGEIYQMVRDSDKACHAKGANADSIGIEHSAAAGDSMTPAQTVSSIALVRWLLSEYKLPKTAIYGHKYTPENVGTTDCPEPPLRASFGSCHHSMGADQHLRRPPAAGNRVLGELSCSYKPRRMAT
jgi:N-acetylmuramoyl-L-alanine amidase